MSISIVKTVCFLTNDIGWETSFDGGGRGTSNPILINLEFTGSIKNNDDSILSFISRFLFFSFIYFLFFTLFKTAGFENPCIANNIYIEANKTERKNIDFANEAVYVRL